MSVYVIECAGLLKIGYSENPERRTAKLFQSTSAYTAPRAAYEARGTQRLIHVIKGARKDDEAMIHRALDDYSIGAEWFVNESAVLEVVHAFEPDDVPAPRIRPQGPAWAEMPLAEQGGQNVELAMSLLNKRRQRAA
jgi:hypothetical protein